MPCVPSILRLANLRIEHSYLTGKTIFGLSPVENLDNGAEKRTPAVFVPHVTLEKRSRIEVSTVMKK